MCNENRFSESGAPIAPTRCAEFARLKAQNEVLREALLALRSVVHTAHVDIGGYHRYGISNGSPTGRAIMLADNALKEVG